MSQLPVLLKRRNWPTFRNDARMIGVRTSTLSSLRGSIARIETHGDVGELNKVALGHQAADALLRGGLAVAAVHEVFAASHQGGSATGFVACIAGRLAPR